MWYPVLIYDNLCSSCTQYAKWVDKLVQGQIVALGHYTQEGKDFKKQIFPKGYEGLEMSWFVLQHTAYGGRAGLKRLIKYILWRLYKESVADIYSKNNFDLTVCTTDCRSVKGVLFRSCSILTNSRIITIPQENNK